MSTHPTQFTKQKQFLVCVDSDGCAMDTMNVKHERFFGPLAADEYASKIAKFSWLTGTASTCSPAHAASIASKHWS